MTQSVITNSLLLSIHTIFTITLVQSDTAVIHCPDIAFLGTSARLTCSTSVDFTDTIYNCPCGSAPQCPVSGCTNVYGYNASIVNQTQTELTIISVHQQHAGNWSCTDGEDVGTTFCHLVVAKIPSVNITSDVDADSVNLGDRISLTVDIRDYHCSDAYNLTLQVGSVTYTCNTVRNAPIKYLPKIVPINVTQTHFGDVKLVFACGSHKWNITPEGVNELLPNHTTVIHCPDIAFLGTSARLTCSTSVSFSNTIYYCPCGFAVQCSAEFGCARMSGYNASIVNQTQTELTIISVQPQHAGNWSCTDRGDVGTTFCHLVVAKIPSVNITSDVDADSVNLGDRISLTVDIRDYHCSDAYNLTLQIGSVTYTCNTGRNAPIKYLPKIVPINVTQTHFGDVKLVFACGNHKWNITPEGVNELLPNLTNIPTTLSTGSLTTWSPPTPPSDTSTLFIVAGGVTSIVIMNMIITFACSYKWKKQALRSGDVCSGTAGRVPQEQEEAAVYRNSVYEASHAPEVRGPLGSTDKADSSTRLGGSDYLHRERRGEYVALDMNAAQPSNMYEHLRTYEQIAYM